MNSAEWYKDKLDGSSAPDADADHPTQSSDTLSQDKIEKKIKEIRKREKKEKMVQEESKTACEKFMDQLKFFFVFALIILVVLIKSKVIKKK